MKKEPKGPSEQRLLQLSIAEVETKEGANGPFIGVKLAGGKWHNCFQIPDPMPKSGELWWANFYESKSGDKTYKNLADMIPDSAYTGPRTASQQTKEPPKEQQKITEERTVPPPKETKKAPAKKTSAKKTTADGKVNIPEKYIVKIQGKDFITYNGLLNLAHEKGLIAIRVVDVVVDFEKNTAWCQVNVLFEDDREFSGVGSATSDNLKAMVKGHFVEMAHTRAKARALRDALNIDMVASVELAEE
jgi:hypothetical protein